MVYTPVLELFDTAQNILTCVCINADHAGAGRAEEVLLALSEIRQGAGRPGQFDRRQLQFCYDTDARSFRRAASMVPVAAVAVDGGAGGGQQSDVFVYDYTRSVEMGMLLQVLHRVAAHGFGNPASTPTPTPSSGRPVGGSAAAAVDPATLYRSNVYGIVKIVGKLFFYSPTSFLYPSSYQTACPAVSADLPGGGDATAMAAAALSPAPWSTSGAVTPLAAAASAPGAGWGMEPDQTTAASLADAAVQSSSSISSSTAGGVVSPRMSTSQNRPALGRSVSRMVMPSSTAAGSGVLSPPSSTGAAPAKLPAPSRDVSADVLPTWPTPLDAAAYAFSPSQDELELLSK